LLSERSWAGIGVGRGRNCWCGVRWACRFGDSLIHSITQHSNTKYTLFYMNWSSSSNLFLDQAKTILEALIKVLQLKCLKFPWVSLYSSGDEILLNATDSFLYKCMQREEKKREVMETEVSLQIIQMKYKVCMGYIILFGCFNYSNAAVAFCLTLTLTNPLYHLTFI